MKVQQTWEEEGVSETRIGKGRKSYRLIINLVSVKSCQATLATYL
jgi:hypothetical protein